MYKCDTCHITIVSSIDTQCSRCAQAIKFKLSIPMYRERYLHASLSPLHVLKSERGDYICNWCIEYISDVGLRGRQWCAICRIVCYCSKECQRKGWSTHKRVCHHYDPDTITRSRAIQQVDEFAKRYIILSYIRLA
jgi:hypothetical protein